MRQEKQLLLDQIEEEMNRSSAYVLTNYRDLNPNLSSELRINMAKAGGKYLVVKKRILAKVAGFSAPNSLDGHIGILFIGDDIVQTTKSLCEFKEKNQGAFDVIGGHFEGRVVSAQDVIAISKLPSQDEMRSQFLGLLEAPMAQTLSTFEALLSSVMYCLENKAGEVEKGE